MPKLMRPLVASLFVAAAMPALTGCSYFAAVARYNREQSRIERAADSQAAANITAAQPAIEGYKARHGTYEGVSIKRLRVERNVWVVQGIRFVSVSKSSYCVESSANGETWSSRGPWGKVVEHPC
jgi:hypothetical protein